MIILPRSADQQAVQAAAQNPGGSVKIAPLLLIGDRDYSSKFFDGDWGQSAIPISLKGSIASPLPRSLENEQVTLSFLVNGIKVPQLIGNFNQLARNQDRVTTGVNAVSSGALLPRVFLSAPVEYSGVPPEFIIQDAVMRCVGPLGGYDAANIEIEALGTPTLDFTGSNGFKPQETPNDILSRLGQNQQFAYIYSDTANNGFKAAVDRGTGDAQNIAFSYNAKDIPDWIPPARQTELYSSVVVYHEAQDGTWDYSASADIKYRGVKTPPFANTPLLVPLSASTGFGADVAQQLAWNLAEAQSRGRYTGGCTLPFYNALIEKNDSIKVDEQDTDDDGRWARSWLLRVNSYDHVWSTSSTTTTTSTSTTGVTVVGPAQVMGTSSTMLTLSSRITYTATLLHEEQIKAPAFIVPGTSGGVLQAYGDPYFGNAQGFWIETALVGSWITTDSTGVYVDPALSGGDAFADATGVYFNF